jgi:hypothetical protein
MILVHIPSLSIAVWKEVLKVVSNQTHLSLGYIYKRARLIFIYTNRPRSTLDEYRREEGFQKR